MNEYFIKRPLQDWWLTAVLIACNVLMFLLQFLNGVDPVQPTVSDLITWGADFAPLTLGSENWRLVSSMFLHIGIIHLIVNMWALYLFGVYAEFYYGRLQFLVIYLLAGITGNLVTNFINLHEASLQAQKQLLMQAAPFMPTVSAGASGAIMGIGAALLVAALWPRTDLPVHYRLNKNGVIVLMLLNLGIGIIFPGINNMAHLGGFMAGVVLALFYRISLNTRLPFRILLQALVILAIIGTMVYTDQWLLQQASHLTDGWSVYAMQ